MLNDTFNLLSSELAMNNETSLKSFSVRFNGKELGTVKAFGAEEAKDDAECKWNISNRSLISVEEETVMNITEQIVSDPRRGASLPEIGGLVPWNVQKSFETAWNNEWEKMHIEWCKEHDLDAKHDDGLGISETTFDESHAFAVISKTKLTFAQEEDAANGLIQFNIEPITFTSLDGNVWFIHGGVAGV